MQIRKTLKSGIVHFTLLLWCKLMNTLVITKKKQTRNCVCQLELTGLVYYVL